jgi:hypothetical protein
MMDVALLKKFNLITPDDYVSTQYQSTQPPQGLFLLLKKGFHAFDYIPNPIF